MGLCVNHVAGLPSFRLMAPHSGLCADYRARKSVVKMKQVPRREGEAGSCRVMKWEWGEDGERWRDDVHGEIDATASQLRPKT